MSFIQSYKDLSKDKPVLIYFSGSHCMPCRMVGPVIEKIKTDYQGKAVVQKILTDDEEGYLFAKENNVSSLPTIIVFKDEKETARLTGLKKDKDYRDALDKVL